MTALLKNLDSTRLARFWSVRQTERERSCDPNAKYENQLQPSCDWVPSPAAAVSQKTTGLKREQTTGSMWPENSRTFQEAPRKTGAMGLAPTRADTQVPMSREPSGDQPILQKKLVSVM